MSLGQIVKNVTLLFPVGVLERYQIVSYRDNCKQFLNTKKEKNKEKRRKRKKKKKWGGGGGRTQHSRASVSEH